MFWDESFELQRSFNRYRAISRGLLQVSKNEEKCRPVQISQKEGHASELEKDQAIAVFAEGEKLVATGRGDQ